MANNFWFYFLAAFIFLILSIYTTTLVIKRRSKYNITMLIIYVIFFVVTTLSYFYPRLIFPRAGRAGIIVQIMVWTAVMISLGIFLFYPEVKGFFKRRKK